MIQIATCRRCGQELPPNVSFFAYLLHRWLVCIPRRGVS